MTDFERQLVNSFNNYFEREDAPEGVAHRKKQHRYSSQLCDVLVDSPDLDHYLAIENKSVKQGSKNKLYFSSHFSEADGKHQVERISEFVDSSGRKGWLAVEIRRGRGKQRLAFFYPWEKVRRRYEEERPGIPLDEIKNHRQLKRDGSTYKISSIFT